MAQGRIVGKLVGLPVCSDPQKTGLKFTVDTTAGRRHFQVAGDSPLEQSPLSALAMSAALAAAALRGFDVEVVYDEDCPHVAAGVVVPYPNPNHPAEGGDTVPNPYRQVVNTMTVLDYGGGPCVETDLSWAGPSGNVYFGSNDADHAVHWATLLALALKFNVEVTIDWTMPQRTSDRQITKLTIG